MASLCSAVRMPAGRGVCLRRRSILTCASFTPVTTKTELKANGGRVVKEVGGKPVLVQLVGEDVFCVSNKCPHLNLSMQGKTALLSATVSDGCIVCPAHKTAFDLSTGAVVGPWCPGMPDLPFVGKVNNDVKPLPVYTVRVDGDAVAVSV